MTGILARYYSMLKISPVALFLTSCITLVLSQLETMADLHEKENSILQHISRSNNQFSNTFYANVATNNKVSADIACSPLSAHVILYLAAYGARGKTEKELKSGLYLPTDNSVAHEDFKSLLNTLNNTSEVELSLANTIYVQEDVSLAPEFVSLSSEFFYSDIPRVDFKNSAACTKEINSWVEKQTNNKIKDIISADDINEETKVILVNALYFKGAWARQFKTEFTEDRPFYTSKDVKIHVPTMFNKFKYPHGQAKELNAKIIELPYLNADFSMLILLPNEVDGLTFLETNYNKENIDNVHWQSNEIELFLPKFKVECILHLEETLQQMGMKIMFSDLADFSGMTKIPLKVDKIIQKAFVEVNEEGSEAAVATAMGIRRKKAAVLPETFVVDRPFMFVIQHKPSNIPLFVGSIRNLQTPYRKDEL